MKTLNIYVTKAFLATFLTAIGILTFGMTGARLMKVFEYISSGVPATNAFLFLIYVIPTVLTLTIPWAALVSVMLVFGRLSADNEITAMRASGVSILQIVSPIIMIAFFLTCLCLYLQLQVGPHYLGKARAMVRNVLIDQPTAIFEPGLPVKFNDLLIYIGGKDGNKIHEVQVYRMNDDNGSWQQDVTAATGIVKVDKTQQILQVVLYNATIAAYEGKTVRHTFSRELTFTINYGKEFRADKVTTRDKFLRVMEILARLSLEKKMGRDTTRLEVELNSRIALALAPIAFLLLGMPLAIRTSRRETSVGLFLSVLLAGIYFGGVMVSDVLRDNPGCFPQYLVWIPPALFQIFGAIYIFKIARR
ncbi:MAG: LptF/LptG family permease [Lentisphaeria bacterium]|nr:LptF/LptG family permease [Lentisphaeria bacterium]